MKDLVQNLIVDWDALCRKTIILISVVVFSFRKGHVLGDMYFESILGQILFYEIVSWIFASFSSKMYTLDNIIEKTGFLPNVTILLRNTVLQPLQLKKKKSSDIFDITVWIVAYNIAISFCFWVISVRDLLSILRPIIICFYFGLQVLLPLVLPHLKIISDMMMLAALSLLS